MPQLARVGVSAETWTTFRQLALRRGLSVTAYLAKLVEAELKRHEGTELRSLDSDAPDMDVALAALREVRRGIDELDDIAGRLARAALRNGGSWRDVGSSLALDSSAAQRAYEAGR